MEKSFVMSGAQEESMTFPVFAVPSCVADTPWWCRAEAFLICASSVAHHLSSVAITWVTFSFLRGNKVTVRTVVWVNVVSLLFSFLCAGVLANLGCLVNVAGQCILESSPLCLGAFGAISTFTCGECAIKGGGRV
jgi:hypothetical protein